MEPRRASGVSKRARDRLPVGEQHVVIIFGHDVQRCRRLLSNGRVGCAVGNRVDSLRAAPLTPECLLIDHPTAGVLANGSPKLQFAAPTDDLDRPLQINRQILIVRMERCDLVARLQSSFECRGQTFDRSR